MELELTLNNAIKVKAEIVQFLKENRKEIIDKSKEKDKDKMNVLTLHQVSLSEDLINIKDRINQKNVELGINKLIYTLSECRELIITYEKLINNLNKEDDELIKSYNDSIERLKDKSEKIEEKLEEINNSYTIKIELYSNLEKITKIN